MLGAEVAATVAPDDPGFFNYTSYEYSALRNFRVGVSAELRANDYIQVLGELRLDQGDVVRRRTGCSSASARGRTAASTCRPAAFRRRSAP